MYTDNLIEESESYLTMFQQTVAKNYLMLTGTGIFFIRNSYQTNILYSATWLAIEATSDPFHRNVVKTFGMVPNSIVRYRVKGATEAAFR